MKHILAVILLVLSLFWATVSSTFAITNPLSTANNKVGIHILFPDELPDAAKLINSSGGQWGYVIIPIQSGEKDLTKWQKFMDTAKELKVIPIIRISSEGDYFNTKVWRKPTETDIIDFANFLNSLSWPTKNRYVVIYNEVNRADEWGGSVDPADYANLLSYAVTVFKSKSPDFFIISSGFDNASANTAESMNEYDYMRAMNQAVPNIFSQVDGLGSHSYPNPGFSKSPNQLDQMSIASFRYQNDLIKRMGGKPLPVFITETGWSTERVSPSLASSYLQTAFTSVWTDETVVAVLPFIFKAGPPFSMFSFINADGSQSLSYKVLFDLPKTKGSPEVSKTVLGKRITKKQLEEKEFSSAPVQTQFDFPPGAKLALKWFLKMPLE